MQRLEFGVVDQTIEEVNWPSCLEYLVFGEDFNSRVKTVVWPSSFKDLSFGFRFNQPIEKVCVAIVDSALDLWPCIQPVTGSSGMACPASQLDNVRV